MSKRVWGMLLPFPLGPCGLVAPQGLPRIRRLIKSKHCCLESVRSPQPRACGPITAALLAAGWGVRLSRGLGEVVPILSTGGVACCSSLAMERYAALLQTMARERTGETQGAPASSQALSEKCPNQVSTTCVFDPSSRRMRVHLRTLEGKQVSDDMALCDATWCVSPNKSWPQNLTCISSHSLAADGRGTEIFLATQGGYLTESKHFPF